MQPARDQIVGCMLGGAIGDAFGGPYEGQVSPTAKRDPSPSPISDDTQLTLAVCEAIGEGATISPERVAERLVAWYRSNRITGAGSSTLKALRDLDAGAHWALSGREGEFAAGNGAAVRAAPLAFCVDLGVDEDRTIVRDVCRITHRSDEAYAGALAMIRAIQIMTSNASLPSSSLPSLVAESLPDTRVRDALLTAASLPGDCSIRGAARELGCSGYVVHSVPLAVFAAQQIAKTELRELLVEVVEAGGDTDSTAAMVGQIAGAFIGAQRLGPELRSCVADADLVVRTADELAARITG